MSNEIRFEAGDWVVREVPCSFWCHGSGARRVVGATTHGLGFSDDAGPNTWTAAHFRHATPEEIEAVPIEVGDWIRACNRYLEPGTYRVQNVEQGEEHHHPHYRTECAFSSGEPRRVWATNARHPTPEEYREAMAQQPAADDPDTITLTLGRDASDAFDDMTQDASLVPDDWNTLAGDSDLEDSQPDTRSLDPEALERTLGEMQARIDVLEVPPLPPAAHVSLHRERLDAIAQRLDAMAPRLEALEGAPEDDGLLPMLPQQPPLLYDRVTGAGPYVRVHQDGDDAASDDDMSLGHEYYYAGQREDDNPFTQGIVRLYPQTLTPEKPGEEPPPADVLAELRERAAREKRAAHDAGYASGRGSGYSQRKSDAKAEAMPRPMLAAVCFACLAVAFAGGSGVESWWHAREAVPPVSSSPWVTLTADEAAALEGWVLPQGASVTLTEDAPAPEPEDVPPPHVTMTPEEHEAAPMTPEEHEAAPHIRDMKPGEMAWTVPWAVQVDKNGSAFINPAYLTWPDSRGTSKLHVAKIAGGYMAELMWGCDYTWEPQGYGPQGAWNVKIDLDAE